MQGASGIVTEPATYELLLRAFFTVWLHSDTETYFRRVMAQNDARIARPGLYKEAMDAIRRAMDSRRSLYQMADQSLETTNLSIQGVVETLLPMLIKSYPKQADPAIEISGGVRLPM